jgi:hypothetical protein
MSEQIGPRPVSKYSVRRCGVGRNRQRARSGGSDQKCAKPCMVIQGIIVSIDIGGATDQRVSSWKIATMSRAEHKMSSWEKQAPAA